LFDGKSLSKYGIEQPALSDPKKTKIEREINPRRRHHKAPAAGFLVRVTAQANELYDALSTSDGWQLAPEPEIENVWAEILDQLATPELSSFAAISRSEAGVLGTRRLLAGIARRDDEISRSVTLPEKLLTQMVDEVQRLHHPSSD
jgi:hypothetical protein